jgi:hypothetical protein
MNDIETVEEHPLPLDMSYKGKEIGRFSFLVERSKIKELCLAIGDDNPIFFDPEAAKAQGYSDTPAPLTFASLISFWGFPEIWDRMTEAGIDIKRLLHAKEDYEYLKPLYPGTNSWALSPSTPCGTVPCRWPLSRPSSLAARRKF